MYLIRFSNGALYVGGSYNLRQRVGVFKQEMKKGNLSTKNLKAAHAASEWATFEVLEIVENAEFVFAREDIYLKKFMEDPNCINRSASAVGNSGVHWSAEERASISRKLLGVKKSDETRRRMSEAKKSRK